MWDVLQVVLLPEKENLFHCSALQKVNHEALDSGL